MKTDANTHPKSDPGPMPRMINFHLSSKASSSVTASEDPTMTVQSNPEQALASSGAGRPTIAGDLGPKQAPANSGAEGDSQSPPGYTSFVSNERLGSSVWFYLQILVH